MSQVQLKLESFEMGRSEKKIQPKKMSQELRSQIISLVKKNYGEYLQDIGRSDCNIVCVGGNLYHALWRSGSRRSTWYGNPYANQPEHLTICGEMSERIYDDIVKNFGHVAQKINGYYVGEGAKYSEDKSGGHVFVILEDGTIIDGAFKQYQDPTLPRRKRINIVEPSSPEYKNYTFSSTELDRKYIDGKKEFVKSEITPDVSRAQIAPRPLHYSIFEGKKETFLTDETKIFPSDNPSFRTIG